jgi:PleD family two-component response regulator
LRSDLIPAAQSPRTILIAVTDIFFYAKIREALRPHGFQFERARKQQDVPEMATTHNPAAMILNMNETAFDAFQALEEIRQQEAFKKLPVLAFANHEEVETWRRAKDLGVTKIVSRNEFSSRMAELVSEMLGGQ